MKLAELGLKTKPETRSKIVNYWLPVPNRSGVEVVNQ